eukprot:gene33433-40444_t
MPVIVVNHGEILSPHMPNSLLPYMDAGQWQAINASMNSVTSQATCLICMVEWGICLVFCFPCIFCCHGCLTKSFLDGNWQSECRKLNNSLFAGRPVLHGMGSSLTVNTDMLQPAPQMIIQQHSPMYAPAVMTAQPVMATAVPIQDNQVTYKEDETNRPSAPDLPAGSSFGSSTHTMTVTIPPNTPPGALLTVSSPTGQMVQVQVGPQHRPGDQITVQY